MAGANGNVCGLPCKALFEFWPSNTAVKKMYYIVNPTSCRQPEDKKYSSVFKSPTTIKTLEKIVVSTFILDCKKFLYLSHILYTLLIVVLYLFYIDKGIVNKYRIFKLVFAFDCALGIKLSHYSTHTHKLLL